MNSCITKSVSIWSCSQTLVFLKVSELLLWESSFSILFLFCECLSRGCFWLLAALHQCCDLLFMLSLFLCSCCAFLLSQHIINTWKRLTLEMILHEYWEFSSACFAVTQLSQLFFFMCSCFWASVWVLFWLLSLQLSVSMLLCYFKVSVCVNLLSSRSYLILLCSLKFISILLAHDSNLFDAQYQLFSTSTSSIHEW